jgi:hypothetical protein
MRDYAYLKDKQVIKVTFDEYLNRLKEQGDKIEERRVGDDKVGDARVSTVFLSLNHGFGYEELWFETMIFGGENDLFCERYSTYDQAEHGHKRIVEALKNGTEP